jgi:hypothetical protein
MGGCILARGTSRRAGAAAAALKISQPQPWLRAKNMRGATSMPLLISRRADESIQSHDPSIAVGFASLSRNDDAVLLEPDLL